MLSRGSTVCEEMVGQSATREREPSAREVDFKEQAEDIEETIQAAEAAEQKVE